MRIPKPILERRRSIRVDENLEFQFGISGYDLQTTTLNISNHGAMCSVDTDIPLMTKLKIAISIPSVASSANKTKKILVSGVVVRKERVPSKNCFYIGVFFSDIKTKDQEILDEFIRHRLSTTR